MKYGVNFDTSLDSKVAYEQMFLMFQLDTLPSEVTGLETIIIGQASRFMDC